MPRAGATLPEAGGLHPTIRDSIQVSQGRRHGAPPPGPGCAMHAARIGDEQSGVGIRGVGAGGRLMRRIGPARGWRAAEIAPGSSRIDPRGTGGRPRLSRWRARVGAPLLASHVPSPAGVGPLSRPGRHRARGPRALALLTAAPALCATGGTPCPSTQESRRASQPAMGCSQVLDLSCGAFDVGP